jgi:hypothetical protein
MFEDSTDASLIDAMGRLNSRNARNDHGMLG